MLLFTDIKKTIASLPVFSVLLLVLVVSDLHSFVYDQGTGRHISTGSQNQSGFGRGLALLGDINGDGYDDAALGAPYFDNGQTDEGKVFLYFGSSTGFPSNPSWTAEGDADSAAFGWSVIPAGDINGDGYKDFLVGAPGLGNRSGKLYLFKGSASGIQSSPLILSDSQNGAMFGYTAHIADFNGDGYPDLAAGAPYYDNGQTDEGKVYVYNGSSSGYSSSPSWTAESNSESAVFGWSLAAMRRSASASYSDLLAGAPSVANNGGRLFLYQGSASGLSNSYSLCLQDSAAGARFGFAIACAGDVNGDGYSDILAGAPCYSNGQTEEGRAYLYYGNGNGFSNPWTIEANSGSGHLGQSLAGCGDLNGDGYSELAIGVPGLNSSAGAVYLIKGSSAGPASTFGILAGAQQGEQFGSRLSPAAANSHNKNTLLISGIYYSSSGNTLGQASYIKDVENVLNKRAEEDSIPESLRPAVSFRYSLQQEEIILDLPQSPDAGACEITLLGLRGEHIRGAHLRAGDRDYRMNVADLPSGLYFLVIRSDRGFKAERIAIAR